MFIECWPSFCRNLLLPNESFTAIYFAHLWHAHQIITFSFNQSIGFLIVSTKLLISFHTPNTARKHYFYCKSNYSQLVLIKMFYATDVSILYDNVHAIDQQALSLNLWMNSFTHRIRDSLLSWMCHTMNLLTVVKIMDSYKYHFVCISSLRLPIDWQMTNFVSHSTPKSSSSRHKFFEFKDYFVEEKKPSQKHASRSNWPRGDTFVESVR